MAFSLQAFLTQDAANLSNDILEVRLQEFFSQEKVIFRRENLPFNRGEVIVITFDGWWIQVSYEQGARIRKAAAEACDLLGDAADSRLGNVDSRIRVVFGDDPDAVFTNEIVYMVDFLRHIPGVVIFDPQKNDILHFSA